MPVKPATLARRQQEATDPATPPARLVRLARHPQLVPLLAANPSTPPAFLEKLGRRKDETIRRAVAANPNTPWPSLMKLVYYAPQAILENPALPLLLFEDLKRYSELAHVQSDVALGLLRDETTPAWDVRIFLKHAQAQVREAAQHHIHVAGEVGDDQEVEQALQEAMLDVDWRSALFTMLPDKPADWLVAIMAQHKSLEVRKTIARREDTSAFVLAQLADDAEKDVRYCVAANPNTPVDALMRLVADTEPAVCGALTLHPQIDQAQLVQWVGHANPLLREAVAHHLQLPASCLMKLAGDGDMRVRLAVAMNPHAAPVTLAQLARDSEDTIRQSVAQHPATPANVLSQLAQDMDCGVRQAVATHPQTPVLALAQLAQDAEYGVRIHVADHLQTPQETIEQLCRDSIWQVRRAVATHKRSTDSMLTLLARSREAEVREAVAQHPNTPAQALASLAGRRIIVVLRAVASHPHTLRETLEKLSGDSDWQIASAAKARLSEVKDLCCLLNNAPDIAPEALDSYLRHPDVEIRHALAEHCHTPLATLTQLAGDSTASVRATIARHPRLSMDLLTMLAQDTDDSVRRSIADRRDLPADFFSSLALDADEGVRCSVAGSPSTPLAALVSLAQDAQSHVRSSVAGNPSTPVAILVQLAQDTSSNVRISVAQNRHTPAELLMQLARDNDNYVQAEVACHPDITPQLFAVILQHSLAPLHPKILQSPLLPLELMVKYADGWNMDIMRRPQLPTPLLAFYTHNSVKSNLLDLAHHPCTPAAVLDELANERDPEVRLAVIQHPNTHLITLAMLCRDDREQVRTAAQQACISATRRISSVTETWPLAVRQQTLVHLCLSSGNKNIFLHQCLLLSIGCYPREVLAVLAQSLIWIERYIVARHPNTEPETLQALIHDGNRFVRAAARTQLQQRADAARKAICAW